MSRFNRQLFAGTRLCSLVAIRVLPGGAKWLFRCDCGAFIAAQKSNMLKRAAEGCTYCSAVLNRHGMKETPTWKTWSAMRSRCNNPNATGYHRYGGRGIRICERWDSFDAFRADMGERPAGKTLDRIDSNGNYCPDNCRWATARDQSRNQSTNRHIIVDGETLTLAAVSEKYGVKQTTIAYRLGRGWPIDRAVKEPSRLTR